MWQHWKSPNLYQSFGDSDHLFSHIRDVQQSAKALVVNNDTLKFLCNIAFNHASQLSQNNISFSSHPLLTVSNSPPQIQFLSPLFHLKTSTYADMHLFLNDITLKYIRM
jgi:hypothetical protein